MIRQNQAHVLVAGCAFLMSVAWAGCANKYVRKTTPTATETASATGSESDNEPSVRNMMLHAIPEVKTVHFDYDSSLLSEKARAVLKNNAEWLKNHEAVSIQIAGDCDQRGTEAYNLALGQRRAHAVREYYAMLGVAARRVATISYGKEKPLCSEMNETCWSRNRRAETLIAYPETLGRMPKGSKQ